MTESRYDVIVVGLGAMGANTAWQLAARGVSVLGIERFGIGHKFGSSHGQTRLFRTACMEHPGLLPLAHESLRLWRELEAHSSSQLLELCGGLMIGPRDGRVVNGTLKAAHANGLELEVLTAAELMLRYPQHQNVPSGHIAVVDPEAGVVRPEVGVEVACQAALDLGAQIHSDTKVLGIDLVPDGVVVRTATRDFRASQAVVTAGSWLQTLVPGLPLEPLRTPMTWFAPRTPSVDFDLARFPTFIREFDNGDSSWGHGATWGHDAKIGLGDGGSSMTATTADELDRAVREQDYAEVSNIVRTTIPGLDPSPSAVTICIITNSPDMQFQLGRPYGDPRLVIGGGDSGHAFKHATGIGQYLAQVTVGEPPTVDLAFTDPDRFL